MTGPERPSAIVPAMEEAMKGIQRLIDRTWRIGCADGMEIAAQAAQALLQQDRPDQIVDTIRLASMHAAQGTTTETKDELLARLREHYRAGDWAGLIAAIDPEGT